MQIQLIEKTSYFCELVEKDGGGVKEEEEERGWGSRGRRKEDEARKEEEPKGIMLKEQPYKLKIFLVMLSVLKPKRILKNNKIKKRLA